MSQSIRISGRISRGLSLFSDSFTYGCAFTCSVLCAFLNVNIVLKMQRRVDKLPETPRNPSQYSIEASQNSLRPSSWRLADHRLNLLWLRFGGRVVFN